MSDTEENEKAAAVRHLRQLTAGSPLADVNLEACLALAIVAHCDPIEGDPTQCEQVGSTRFGGLPDLPPEVNWPQVDGVVLEFVGQVALRELAPWAGDEGLPRDGLLLFFFDGMLTGYDKGQTLDRARVLWAPPESHLRRAVVPAAAPAQFQVHPPKRASWRRRWELPEFEEVNADEFATIVAREPVVPPDQRSAYELLRNALAEPWIRSKMLGHPDGLQNGEVLFNAVLRRDELKNPPNQPRFAYEDYEWTNQQELRNELRQLRLLLQAASDENGAWGGSGVLYFWIDRDALAERRFDEAFARMYST